jgi:hypothetical protein
MTRPFGIPRVSRNTISSPLIFGMWIKRQLSTEIYNYCETNDEYTANALLNCKFLA